MQSMVCFCPAKEVYMPTRLSMVIIIAIFLLLPTQYPLYTEGSGVVSRFPFSTPLSFTINTGQGSAESYTKGTSAYDPVTNTGFPARTSSNHGCSICHEVRIYPMGVVINSLVAGSVFLAIVSLTDKLKKRKNNHG